MKRLLLTCTDLMAIQFLVPHVKYLSAHGFSVELACSDVGGRLDDLHRALDGCLTEQEKQVVVLRYGLDGQPPKRQREVAQITGISRSYVSRIEKKALEKLRRALDG